MNFGSCAHSLLLFAGLSELCLGASSDVQPGPRPVFSSSCFSSDSAWSIGEEEGTYGSMVHWPSGLCLASDGANGLVFSANCASGHLNLALCQDCSWSSASGGSAFIVDQSGSCLTPVSPRPVAPLVRMLALEAQPNFASSAHPQAESGGNGWDIGPESGLVMAPSCTEPLRVEKWPLELPPQTRLSDFAGVKLCGAYSLRYNILPGDDQLCWHLHSLTLCQPRSCTLFLLRRPVLGLS